MLWKDHPLLLLALLALARKFRERSEEEYAQAVDKLGRKFAEKWNPDEHPRGSLGTVANL